MPSLLDLDQPAPQGGLLGPLQIQQPDVPPDTSHADALAATYNMVSDYLAKQQQISADRGLWDESTGMPTGAGLLDAARQYSNAVMMGTTAPGTQGGFSLEQVHPRTLRPLSEETDMTQAGAHAFSIKDPNGDNAGIVDTEWNPDTGGLHIADFQSNEGANSLGLGAVRQIRDLLLARYPGVRTLTGQRITGATYADRPSGSGPGREAMQIVRDQNRSPE